MRLTRYGEGVVDSRHGTGDRVIFAANASAARPTIVITAGVHGNEPAGLRALERVRRELSRTSVRLDATVRACIGNQRALGRSVRFVDRDFNRHWTPEHVHELARGGNLRRAEDHEQRALLEIVAPLCARANSPVVFLDLHSTSGPTKPFALFADVARNRRVALALGLPTVMGLEEAIDDAMLGFFCNLGHVGVSVEGGQHEAPRTIDHLEAIVWRVLEITGAVSPNVPAVAHAREVLRRASAGAPIVTEVLYRHLVTDVPGFKMVRRFDSFEPVEKGDVVAEEHGAPVRAPVSGLMLMPRYHPVGEDGYFLVRRVPRWRSLVADWLQSNELEVLARFLPGVHATERRDELEIHAGRLADAHRTALHMFGYRRVRPRGDHWVFSRRRPDHHGRSGDGERLVDAFLSEGARDPKRGRRRRDDGETA